MATTTGVLLHVADIIETELDLSEGQVYLYKTKWTLPPTNGLWVAVGFVSGKPYASDISLDAAGNQVQKINWRSLLFLEARSQDTSALDRLDDLVLALGSYYSENVQTRAGINIARIPEQVMEVSEVEGPAIPYRFNITFIAQYAVEKVRQTPVYDTFLKPEITVEH